MSRLWAERLEHGEGVEGDLRAHFARIGWGVVPGPKDASYDFAVNNGSRLHLVEVKDESRYVDSGNLCIETTQGVQRRPSGISTSESTVTVHVLGVNAALYKTQLMRIALKRLGLKVVAFKGADNHNCGVLVPVSLLLDEGAEWFDFIAVDRVHESVVLTGGTR